MSEVLLCRTLMSIFQKGVAPWQENVVDILGSVQKERWRFGGQDTARVGHGRNLACSGADRG